MEVIWAQKDRNWWTNFLGASQTYSYRWRDNVNASIPLKKTLRCTLPKTNIATQKCWLGRLLFLQDCLCSRGYVSFRRVVKKTCKSDKLPQEMEEVFNGLCHHGQSIRVMDCFYRSLGPAEKTLVTTSCENEGSQGSLHENGQNIQLVVSTHLKNISQIGSFPQNSGRK